MSAPTDVADQLERLAAHAPVPAVDPEALWMRGRQRQGIRWAVGVAGCVAVLACVGAALATPVLRVVDDPIAVAPDSARRVLPDVFRTPGKWEPAFPAAPGPLVAVGRAPRAGWTSDQSSLWGVSALTGESRFLDLPDEARLLDGAALSDDGTQLAYWISVGAAGRSTEEPNGRIPTGVAILDLVTGAERRWDARTTQGFGSDGLVWAGDVLWFGGGAYRDSDQNTYEPSIWRWAFGAEPEVAKDFPLLSLGVTRQAAGRFLIESGTMTSKVQVVDASGDVTTVRLEHRGGTTSEVSMSPDGRLLAGLWHARGTSSVGVAQPLVVGEIDGDSAEMTRVPDVEAPFIRGWRSPTEVVVADYGTDGAIDLKTVDVTDGTVSDLVQLGETALGTIADDAWAGDVIAAPDPPFAPDPRWFGSAAVLISLLLIAGWRGPRCRRGHP